jgi:solute carrier family 39 (zinc transporter), member 1/2/3
MTVFVMFFIELMAARFDIFGEADLEANDHDTIRAMIRDSSSAHDKYSDVEGKQCEYSVSLSTAFDRTRNAVTLYVIMYINEANIQSAPNDNLAVDLPLATTLSPKNGEVTYPPGGEGHLGHANSHYEGDQFAAQMTALFILEFGVIFHSVFIGLTLAVAGEEFTILYIVLCFHQTFEGLGLGSRLASARWPKRKQWIPWVLGSAYGLTTPVAIAIGLGISKTFQPNSTQTLIVNGIFDSISSGILLYTGLVELMAHEFMFNSEMRKSSMKTLLGAFACMCFGAGLMALLGKWA